MTDDILAGAFAGAIARLISAPFDVLKIRFQLQFADKVKYTSMLQAFSTVTREEGFFSLWKGNLSATCLWISYAMVQFSAYGWLKHVGMQTQDPFSGVVLPPSTSAFGSRSSIAGNNAGNNGKHKASGAPSGMWKTIVLFLAGAGAGMIATTATYPFDIMRTQFAVQGSKKVFPNMQSFISSTLQTSGVKGFYVGLSPALIGITPYMGLNFALYETFTSAANKFSEACFPENRPQSKANSLVTILKTGFCGGFAGGVSKFVVFPLDTVKKRMQMQVLQNTLDGAAAMPRYNSILHCVQKTLASEGIKGFYKGIGPTTAKAIISTAITFAAFEGAKDFLKKHRRIND